MEQLLKMEGITKAFFGVSVLKAVDFDLEHGEVHVLLGENGAGKSTLMKILSGAYQLDSGAIFLDGKKLDLAAYNPKTAEHGIQAGSVSAGRSQGFQEAAKKGGLTTLETQWTNADSAKSMNISTDELTAHPDLAGIFNACAASVGDAQNEALR